MVAGLVQVRNVSPHRVLRPPTSTHYQLYLTQCRKILSYECTLLIFPVLHHIIHIVTVDNMKRILPPLLIQIVAFRLTASGVTLCCHA